MPTTPKLDGVLARELFIILGEQATEVMNALVDMNDAHMLKRDDDYYEAAGRAARCSIAMQDVLSALARGDYNKARAKLGIIED